MTTPEHLLNDEFEHLCTGYRAGVEEPAYGATDRLVLQAAARYARRRGLRRRLLGAPALTAAALTAALVALALAGIMQIAPHRRAGVLPPAPADRAGGNVAAATDRWARALTLTMVTEQWTPPPAGQMGLQPMQALTQPSAPTLPSAPSPPVPVPTSTSTSTSTSVDLNAPGALQALKIRRPADYARITAILAGLRHHPDRDVPRWMVTAFDASNVVYLPFWLTSFPPKRRLSFSLDDRRYRVVVTITENGAQVFPVGGGVR